MSILILGSLTIMTAIISGVVGMAGGITLLAGMTFVLSIKDIIPIHGATQLTSNLSRAYLLRQHIRWNFFLAFALGTPLGTLIALKVIKSIHHEEVFIIPIIALILYTLFKPKQLPAMKLHHKGFALLGVITSFMSPLMGATGPLLAPFFLRDDFTKEEIVATKAVTQSLTHLLKIPLFLAVSFPYKQYIWEIITMCLCAVIGTKIGTILLGKISERYFKLIYKSAMFIALIRLIFKTLPQSL